MIQKLAFRRMNSEEFLSSIPRSLHGENLQIISGLTTPKRVTITDGERTAVYVARQRIPKNWRPLHITDDYTEAGFFGEARYVTITDGQHSIDFRAEEVVER